MILNLQNTPAEKDYHGCGWSYLVIKNNIPQLLIYHPDEQSELMPTEIDSIIQIDENYIKEITETTEVYFGMASCREFNVYDKLFPIK